MQRKASSTWLALTAAACLSAGTSFAQTSPVDLPYRSDSVLEPDGWESIDGAGTIRRRDDLFEFGGGLVWEFAHNWSLRPSVLYVRDESNVDGFNYSSTEVLVTVRRGF
jgi:hypothetical protein